MTMILDFIPILNTLVDLSSLFGFAEEPSWQAAIAKLASSVTALHVATPALKRFVDSTAMIYDNKALDMLTNALSLVTDLLVAFGKLDPTEVIRAAKREQA